MRTLYLCGAGNSEGVRLALSINRELGRWEQILLLDDDPARHGHDLLGVEIVGPFGLLARASRDSAEVANLVARTTAGREAARQRIAAWGLPFAALVDPRVDTFGADLGQDVIVYANATVGPEVSLGEGSVVFMGAVAGHECRVGRCCVLAANSVLNARVELGDGVYVGTNATVLPEVKVGAGATIGAGSVVIEDVPAGATVMGVPARTLIAPKAASPAVPEARDLAVVDPALERTISRIWQELLQLRSIEPDGNFFDLGGNSLLALRLSERVEGETGRELPVTDLFRFPTVRALAGYLARSGESRGPTDGVSRATLRRALRARRAAGG
jgi:sugar O-acyltransferase (sialic acid O-acetyltransferase NeuD family)